MSKRFKVVAVSGSVSKPSKTSVLLDEIVLRLGKQVQHEHIRIELSEIGHELSGVLSRQDAGEQLEQALRHIETADLLIVASPVYRASYTGLFKHLFDLVGHETLFDVPVLLAASGGSQRHGLIIDHQLRPLFAFFQTLTLPIGVYATDADFTQYAINNDELKQRINLAVERARPFLPLNEERLSKVA